MIKRVIYPGTFDPLTLGHLDLIKRAVDIFDELIIAVSSNPYKNPLFSLEERVEMLKATVEGIENIKIEYFKGLLIDYARGKKCNVILRGIRATSDFEYEFRMALSNRKMAPEIETIFMMPSETYSYLSSRLIKDIASLGADLSKFVPPIVEKKLKEKLLRK
jgi:pantetheine-phosphate adenylyltransferase